MKRNLLRTVARFPVLAGRVKPQTTQRVAFVTTLLLFSSVVINESRAADLFESGSLPNQMDLSYKVTRGNIELGVIFNSLSKSGESYQTTTTTKPNSLIKLLGAVDAQQQAEFELTTEGVATSLNYRESRSDRPTRWVEFDQDAGVIRFIGESDAEGEKERDARPILDRVEKVPDYDTIDIGSLPYYLMTKPLFELAGARLGIVTGKKIGHYKIEEPISEIVKTPIGDLMTWRIENQRVEIDADGNIITQKHDSDESVAEANERIRRGAAWMDDRIDGATIDQPMDKSAIADVTETSEQVGGNDYGDDDGGAAIIVWLSPAHNNLPVKIVKRKGRRETTLLLARVGTE